MAQVDSSIQDVVRDRRTAAMAALLVVLLLAAFGPRNQRALFATRPFGDAAAAFTAIPDASSVSYPGRTGGNGGDLAYGPGRGGPGGSPAGQPGGVGPLAPAGGAAAPVAGPTSTPLSELASAPEAGGPIPGDIPGTLPGGTTAPDGGGGGGVVGPGPGGGVPGGETLPGGPVTPVASVPEPATWLTMILGIAAIGTLLRARTRRRLARRAV